MILLLYKLCLKVNIYNLSLEDIFMAENKKLNWSRDDVYIISLNNSSDRIEDTKIQCYGNIKKVYEFFAMVDALYDKSWKYVKDHDKLAKEITSIRKKLYEKTLLKDIRDENSPANVEKYLFEQLDDLTQVYRELTGNYVDTGLFPKYTIETNEPGAVRNGRS